MVNQERSTEIVVSAILEKMQHQKLDVKAEPLKLTKEND